MHIFTAVKFNFSTLLIGMFLAALIGYFIGYFLRKLISQYQIKEVEAKKEKIIGDAEQEAQRKLKVAAFEAKEQALQQEFIDHLFDIAPFDSDVETLKNAVLLELSNSNNSSK